MSSERCGGHLCKSLVGEVIHCPNNTIFDSLMAQQNRSYYDLDSYMNPSTASGMLLLIDKSTATPVGRVAAVMNSNQTGWISMFIDEAHRGKGLGRELFKAAMTDVENYGAKIMGLDGVKEQKNTCW